MKKQLLFIIAIALTGFVFGQATTIGLNKTAVATPDICMVSVDDSSKHNIIFWDKTAYTNVDSFITYREVGATYKRIGAQPYSTLSQLLDTAGSVGGPHGGDPNLGNSRYKLQIRDISGTYSALSPYHQTVFMTANGNGQFSWASPYRIEGQPTADTNYVLACDTANTNAWTSVATISGPQQTASDPGFTHHAAIANWRVDALGFNCTATYREGNGGNNTMSARVKSHSNQSNNRSVGIRQLLAGKPQVSVYPNPASEAITIAFLKESAGTSVKIMSWLGNEVYNKGVKALTGDKLVIDISGLSSGMYLVQVISGNGSQVTRITKE